MALPLRCWKYNLWSGEKWDYLFFWRFINKLAHFFFLLSKLFFTPRGNSGIHPLKFLVTDTYQRTPGGGSPLPLKQSAIKTRREPARSYSGVYFPIANYRLSINILFACLIEILSPITSLQLYFHFPCEIVIIPDVDNCNNLLLVTLLPVFKNLFCT